ncbi:hypothetical protein [Propioniciclava sinopodophylli]|uniref:hypothetical protein n=1 Tax=Propioniciclava sinopodophylli TaxID=1837344 RepID=UPI0024906FCE|nr:hypothetical protein [Propioniciclava sinopodophylli]
MSPLPHVGKLYLGPLPLKSFFGITGGVLAALMSVVLFILVFDLALYSLSQFFPLDTAVWGTYAAWASAILPTLGVAVAAATWLAGRHQESIQRAEDAALLVVLERRDGAVTSLLNQSEWPLLVLSSSPEVKKNINRVLRAGAPRLLFEADTEAVRIRIRGCVFDLTISGTLTVCTDDGAEPMPIRDSKRTASTVSTPTES